jgi:hypothetical protein
MFNYVCTDFTVSFPDNHADMGMLVDDNGGHRQSSEVICSQVVIYQWTDTYW